MGLATMLRSVRMRRAWMTATRLWIGGTIAAACLASRVMAEPLPKEACEKLKSEQATLDQAGLRDVLQKGPDWAKSNLDRGKLKQVERYILVDEMLSFRCGLAKAQLTLPFSEEDQPPVPPEAQKTEGTPPAAPPAVKPKLKPKAAQAPAATAPPAPEAAPKPKKAAPAAVPEAPASQPAAAKPAPKPKPKADDAYRPPTPANPATDPFVVPKSPAAK